MTPEPYKKARMMYYVIIRYNSFTFLISSLEPTIPWRKQSLSIRQNGLASFRYAKRLFPSFRLHFNGLHLTTTITIDTNLRCFNVACMIFATFLLVEKNVMHLAIIGAYSSRLLML
jgi:hypothetical protein